MYLLRREGNRETPHSSGTSRCQVSEETASQVGIWPRNSSQVIFFGVHDFGCQAVTIGKFLRVCQ